VSLRGRIFAVIGIMVVAAFIQAGAVVLFEKARNESEQAMMHAEQRFDYQTRMNRVVVELESLQLSRTSSPASRHSGRTSTSDGASIQVCRRCWASTSTTNATGWRLPSSTAGSRSGTLWCQI